MRSARWFGMSVVALVVSGLSGCTQRTTFEGEAKFPGGARGCYDKCRQIGMSMGSFVFVGEYSTGCVCEPMRGGPGPVPEPAAGREADPAASAAATGVVLQMIAEEQAQQRSVYYRGY